MRNEVFEKIKQSRMRYLAELKNSEEREPEDDNKKAPDEKNEENEKNEKFHFPDLTQKLSLNFDISEIAGTIDMGLKGLKSVVSKFFGIINSVFKSTGEKINDTTDKLTERFYNYSSGFFEDRYEYVEIENISGDKTLTAAIPAVFEADFEDGITFFKETWKKLSKIRLVRNIVLFFEFDENITTESRAKNTGVLHEKVFEITGQVHTALKSTITYINTRVVKTSVKRNSVNHFSYKNTGVKRFFTIRKLTAAKMKQILFPAINRFIRKQFSL